MNIKKKSSDIGERLARFFDLSLLGSNEVEDSFVEYIMLHEICRLCKVRGKLLLKDIQLSTSYRICSHDRIIEFVLLYYQSQFE
jgi:hypothetical protein